MALLAVLVASVVGSLCADATAGGTAPSPPAAPLVNPMTGILSTGALQSVSCPLVNECVAVGIDRTEPIVVVGDPATWSAADAHQLTLGSAFGSGGQLNSVSCLTVTQCVAVGEDVGAGEYNNPEIITVSGDPTTWTASDVRQIVLGDGFGSGGQLNSVSCLADDWCTAVGSDLAVTADWLGDGLPIVLSGDPRTWSAPDLRQISATTTGSLNSVTCETQVQCVAVGSIDREPLTMTGNPAQWSARRVRAMVVGGEGMGLGELNGVSCLTATACVAVGDVSPDDGDDEPLTVSGNPATWAASDAHEILLGRRFGYSGTLSSVTCTSVTACVAVGSDGANLNSVQPISTVGDPATLRPRQVRQLKLSTLGYVSGELNGVACSGTVCDAVGDSNYSGGPIQIDGDASTWTFARAEQLTLTGAAFGSTADIASVSCPSAHVCIAVGTDSNGHPFAFEGNPSAWQDARGTQFTSTFGQLNGVSCTSLTECVAVGYDEWGLLVVRGDPETWGDRQVETIKLGPRFGGMGSLHGVSCVSSTYCVAVGTDASIVVRYGEGQPIVLTGDPRTWRTSRVKQLLVREAMGSGADLTDVSCRTRTACVAVGGDNAGDLLTMQGDAPSWHSSALLPLRLPGYVDIFGQLNSVACPSRRWCVAVGASLAGRSFVIEGDPAHWATPQIFRVFVSRAPSYDVQPLWQSTLHQDDFGYNVIGPGSLFSVVGCRTRDLCAAAGNDLIGAPAYVTGAPSQWRLQPADRLRATSTFDSAQLEAVACSSACFGFGNSVDGPYDIRL